MKAMKFLVAGLAVVADGILPVRAAKEIIHDADYYVLEAQHGKTWAQQHQKLDGQAGLPILLHRLFRWVGPSGGHSCPNSAGNFVEGMESTSDFR
jgi:hypothetical protein